MTSFRSVEVCAGAGGQALGLELAGFEHVALVELDRNACRTLRHNRPLWNVVECDIKAFSASRYAGVDLLAGGVPCPPFSVAGKQLGDQDERDLFPEMVRLAAECRPKAVMIENVRGLLDPVFAGYRSKLISQFEALGYNGEWRLLHASDFGVPQLRPRAIFVALQERYAEAFSWPVPWGGPPPTVGEALYGLMASRGWRHVDRWKAQANHIAPTLVGGSKKHGGPDLGPTRARQAWASLGVDGRGLANEAPEPEFEGMPRLTVQMAARLQGFPPEWEFVGAKTPAYRQVGNAFPPPVACAVGKAIHRAMASAGESETGAA